jgi:hypothetical protein
MPVYLTAASIPRSRHHTWRVLTATGGTPAITTTHREDYTAQRRDGRDRPVTTFDPHYHTWINIERSRFRRAAGRSYTG